jgi:hypothetical protein
MHSSVAGLVPSVASTTFYLAVSVVLGGIVSGLIALGIVQFYGREWIQRRTLHLFFKEESASFLHESLKVGTHFRRYSAAFAASLVEMPERVLCRLYYRQISGQFLAAVNSEAALPKGAPTPILSYVAATSAKKQESEGGKIITSQDSASQLHEAVRRIDVLQAELGDAVNRMVMVGLSVAWTTVYLVAALSAAAEIFRQTHTAGAVGAGAWLQFWGPYSLLSLLLAAGLGLCSAACGLVAFGWLDRSSAPK